MKTPRLTEVFVLREVDDPTKKGFNHDGTYPKPYPYTVRYVIYDKNNEEKPFHVIDSFGWRDAARDFKPGIDLETNQWGDTGPDMRIDRESGMRTVFLSDIDIFEADTPAKVARMADIIREEVDEWSPPGHIEDVWPKELGPIPNQGN